MLRITVTKGGQFLDSWVEREVGFDVNIFIREMRLHHYGLDIEKLDFRRVDWHAVTRGRDYIDRADVPHIVTAGERDH